MSMLKKDNYFLFFFIAVVFSFLGYFQILNYPYFVDDFNFLHYSGAETFTTLTDYFTKPIGKHYIPLYPLLNDFLFGFFGQTPYIIRAVSILLFATNVFLLFCFVDRWLGQRRLAILTALLFCFHPINYISVNHITSNFIFLFLSFTLLSFIYYDRYLNNVKSRWGFLSASLFFYLLALVSFEAAFLIPVYLICALVFFKKYNFTFAVKSSIPYFLLGALYFIVWKIITGTGGVFLNAIVSFPFDLPELIGSFISLVQWYISNLLYPVSVVLIHNTHIVQGADLLFVLFWGIVFLGVCAYLIEKFKDDSLQGSVVFLLIGFLPVIPAMFAHSYMGLVIEPHWLHLSSVGFFVLIALIFDRLYDGKSKNMVAISLKIILISYFVLLQFYNYTSRTEHTMAAHWARLNPTNPIPLLNMGKTLSGFGKYDEAAEYYHRILETSNYDPHKVHDNLANVYMFKGDLARATDHVQKALAIYPDYGKAYNTSGVINVNANLFEQAESNFKKAIEVDPNHDNAYLNLSDLYIRRGALVDARSFLYEVLSKFKYHPERIQTYAKIVDLDIKLKDSDGLRSTMNRIKSLDDGWIVMQGVGIRLNEIADFSSVRSYFNVIIAMNRYYKENYFLYGAILDSRQLYDEAYNVWEKGHNLDTSDERFISGMARIKQMKLSKN